MAVCVHSDCLSHVALSMSICLCCFCVSLCIFSCMCFGLALVLTEYALYTRSMSLWLLVTFCPFASMYFRRSLCLSLSLTFPLSCASFRFQWLTAGWVYPASFHFWSCFFYYVCVSQSRVCLSVLLYLSLQFLCLFLSVSLSVCFCHSHFLCLLLLSHCFLASLSVPVYFSLYVYFLFHLSRSLHVKCSEHKCLLADLS